MFYKIIYFRNEKTFPEDWEHLKENLSISFTAVNITPKSSQMTKSIVISYEKDLRASVSTLSQRKR